MTTTSISSHVEHLNSLVTAKRFLGRDFLTWLWYQSETRKEPATFAAEELGETLVVDFWVDDRAVLEASEGGDVHVHALKGYKQSQSAEAAAALMSGKTVRELKLGLNVKDMGEFTAVLNADELNPKSMQLPDTSNPDKGADPDAPPLVTRLHYVEVFLTVLDGLFAMFLKERTGKSWEAKELPAIRDWIKNRRSDGKSGTLH